MLIEYYIEALIVDEVLADEVWEAWHAGEITDFMAVWAWLGIVVTLADNPCTPNSPCEYM